jgi:hypothetical protein
LSKTGRFLAAVVTNKAKRRHDKGNESENGLRMNNEMTMKGIRFSFFADPQEIKAESRPTFGTLPFARHTSQLFAKVKEPNLAYPKFHFKYVNYGL